MRIKIALLSISIFILYGELCAQQPHRFFYVAPNGNDNHPGTINEPIATFEGAQQLVSAFKASHKDVPVTVYFRGGKYYRTQSAVFTAEHSGTEKGPITYRSYPGEQPLILGGKKLDLRWKKYKDDIYKAIVPKELRFESMYVNDEQQVLARYPNYDPGVRIFNGTAEDAIAQKRVDSWQDPEGGYFHVLHRALWGGFHFKITGKDKEGKLEMTGGWQNNRPENGLHDKLRYVENIFEELDADKEWYLDRETNTLYFQPAPSVDLKNANIEVAYLENFIHLKGSAEAPVKHLAFDGFAFNRSVRTFMKTKEPLLRSDWTIYRGGAILIEGAEHCTIQNCDFYQVGSNAVFVSDYNRYVTISGCHMRDIGASAICFVGHPSAVRNPKYVPYGPSVSRDELDTVPGPKNDRYPYNCTAYNNLLHDLGKVEKQGSGIQVSMAMGITVSHNSIYDTPRAGINIGEGAWGGHTLEFNDVFNTVLETSDHGSFNSWGRDRYWMKQGSATEERLQEFPGSPFWDAMETTIIRNNRMRCDHGWDINLDDGSSNYHIYNNLCLSKGIKLREGYMRRVENNITVNNAMHPHVWFRDSKDVVRGNIFWSPHAPISMDGWGTQIDYNWFVNPGSLTKSQEYGIEHHSRAGDPLFVDPDNGDYSLKNESPVYAMGWKNFPMDQFGVVDEDLKAIAKTPELPKFIKPKTTGSDVQPFYGGRLKNVETDGEVSATGLYGKIGVYVIIAPTNGVFEKLKLKKNDVILKVNNSNIEDLDKLLEQKERFGKKNGSIKSIHVWRNQAEVKLE